MFSKQFVSDDYIFGGYSSMFIRDLDKLGYGGSLLGSSHFFLLLQRPHKILFAYKVFKSDLKIIISVFQSNPWNTL